MQQPGKWDPNEILIVVMARKMKEPYIQLWENVRNFGQPRYSNNTATSTTLTSHNKYQCIVKRPHTSPSHPNVAHNNNEGAQVLQVLFYFYCTKVHFQSNRTHRFNTTTSNTNIPLRSVINTNYFKVLPRHHQQSHIISTCCQVISNANITLTRTKAQETLSISWAR